MSANHVTLIQNRRVPSRVLHLSKLFSTQEGAWVLGLELHRVIIFVLNVVGFLLQSFVPRYPLLRSCRFFRKSFLGLLIEVMKPAQWTVYHIVSQFHQVSRSVAYV